MLPFKWPPHHYQYSMLKSGCIKIYIITTTILSWMSVCAINDTSSDTNVLLTTMSSHYLPSDTVTELSRINAVTKTSSRSGTTSTVRPWPSHSFFRSVLSRSDNVVVKSINGSEHMQPVNGAGVLFDKNHSLPGNVAHHLKSQKHSSGKSHDKKTRKRHHVSRKRPDNAGKDNDKSTSALTKTQSVSDRNDTRARAVVMTKFGENSSNTSAVLQRNLFTSFPPEKQQSIITLGSISTKKPDKAVENVANSSQPENSIVNAEMNINSNEYSHINSPHIGFQYEIVIPPPALSPRPTSFKLTENANLSHIPSTTTTMSTTLQPVSQYNTSEANNTKSAGNGSRNTSSLEVKEEDAGKKVANDETTTITISPLENQIDSNENAETAAVAHTILPPPTTLPTFSNLHNNGNEIIPQNLEYSSSPTPTQPPLLDALSLVNRSYYNGESITYNKNHLSLTTKKAYYHHKELMDDPGTMHHNIDDSDDTSGNKNKSFILETPLSTFSPFREINHQQINESIFNKSALGPWYSGDSIVNSTMKHSAFTPKVEWKLPPTHFSSSHTQNRVVQPAHVEQVNYSNKGRPNQLFQRYHSEQMDHFRTQDNSVNKNNSSLQGPPKRSKDGAPIVLLNQRNMFTVMKAGKAIPKLRVESKNTTSIKSNSPPEKLLHDRTNQVEQPYLTTNVLTGPDRTIASASPSYTENDNDYFDEDDAQQNLHHWIESEQGHFVNPSSELPTFTNLTWPYYITSTSESTSLSQGDSSKGEVGAPSAASTALAVSFNTHRHENADFESNYEFYIPSAAAAPHRNPILLAKKSTTTVATPSSSAKSWTKAPNAALSTPLLEDWNHGSKQETHKNKIKQNHWGSQGLSTIKPGQFNDVKLSAYNEKLQNKIKIYENSTGSPKSTPSSINFLSVEKTPATSILSVYNKKKRPSAADQQYLVTSPSSSLSSTWPFGGNEEILGHSETASFVTAKTPTNIWYKPIINHFTASVPINGSNVLFDGVSDKVFNDLPGNGESAILTTTMHPPSTTRINYVGGNGDDETFFSNTNAGKETVPGKLTPSSGRNTTKPEKLNNESKRPILFKVWNIVDGTLQLQNQREIPAWALQGFVIPTSGTILNLQQIPPSLQPLVTSAVAVNKATKHQTNNSTSQYVWKELPIADEFNAPVFSSAMSTTHFPSTKAETSPAAFSTTGISDESLFDNESNQIKIPPNKLGWHEETGVRQSTTKQPISINYVLWNNPASIYGQSIILSTPTPQILLSRQPTPLSYFPSSVITLGENTPRPSVPYGATIKNRGSNLYVTTTTPRHTTTTTTTTTLGSPGTNTDQEKLELLFQNYFQYFITTSTPAPTTTTTTTESPQDLENKVTEDPDDGQQVNNKKVWTDLKKLILRLASTKNGHNDSKASVTLEKDKAEDLDYLGNVAAVALIMSYLRNQYEKGEAATTTQSTTSVPYGVTDDMTPPNKDQLWATVYPLFQHFLNNPNYAFVPPPPPQSSNQQLLSLSQSVFEERTPTSSDLVSFTEPPSGTGSSNYFTQNTEFNHYASYYYPTITTESSQLSHIMPVTRIPHHGATTAATQLVQKNLQTADDVDVGFNASKKGTKTLVLTRKIRRKKTDRLERKKKSKAGKTMLGSILHKKLLKKPFAKLSKKQKKYWFDLKFEIDFIDIIKKKMLYLLALQYMPVVMVLAFGVLPLALSLVPLIYKIWWMKYKKSKYIKVKVPIPYPKPYPVPVYKPPPHYYGRFHHSHSPFEGEFKRPDNNYENGPDHGHNYNDVIHIDSPLMFVDHHHAADTTGNDNSNENSRKYAYQHIQSPERERGGEYAGLVNSFNYDPVKHPAHSAHAGVDFLQPSNNYYSNQQDQEVHVHLHDDESIHRPQYQDAPVSDSPSVSYTSYNEKDLQPYPTTQSYGMGFDVGSTLAAMTNKHDMEILKILFETKKEKLSKLLDMWNLAKYGAAVASDAAVNAISGGPSTPTQTNSGKKKRKRRKRRKKRKHSIDGLPEISKILANNVTNNATT